MSISPSLRGFPRLYYAPLLLGIALLATSPAYAESYVGIVCLEGVVGERENGPVPDQKFVAAYDVSYMGGTSYALAGNANISGEPFVVSGFGNRIDSVLFMNLSTTQSHADGWRDSGVMQVQLNLATMTGTFYENGRDFDTVHRVWDDRYTSGTVSRVPCP